MSRHHATAAHPNRPQNRPTTAEAEPASRNARYTLAEAARRFFLSHNGGPVHTATITRWILYGVKTRSGERLKLRAERMPGHWVLTEQAIEEFIQALTLDRNREPAREVEQPRPVIRDHERSERKLAEARI